MQQYEIIHNPQTVDLLVSITHSAAAEGVIDEPLPIGMALRVQLPDVSELAAPPVSFLSIVPQQATAPAQPGTAVVGPDRLCDFDDLSLPQVSIERFVCCVFQFTGLVDESDHCSAH